MTSTVRSSPVPGPAALAPPEPLAAPTPATRRRVTIVVNGTVVGGAERTTVSIATALATLGHEVTLVETGVPVYGALLAATGAPVRVRHTGAPSFQQSLAWWLRTLAPTRGDVCVVSKGGFEMLHVPLDAAARLLFRRYMAIEHHPAHPFPTRTRRRHLGGLVPGLSLWWYWRLVPVLLHRAAVQRVLAVSDVVCEHLVKHMGYAPHRLHRVHCGIRLGRFAPSPDTRARVREEWGVPGDALLFGAVGRLHEVKRFDLLLELFAEYRRRHAERDAWLALAGEGPERDALARQARELGVAHRVVLPGWVPDAAPALAALDVFLMTSREEGLGIALLEAMASGCRCVAMDAGGPAEVIREPGLGWLVPRDDGARFLVAMEEAAGTTGAALTTLHRRMQCHLAEWFDESRQAPRAAETIAGA